MRVEKDEPDRPEAEPVDKYRRDFLRTSVYAAYATPLITALLVEDAAAGQSCTPQMLAACRESGFKWGWCSKCK